MTTCGPLNVLLSTCEVGVNEPGGLLGLLAFPISDAPAGNQPQLKKAPIEDSGGGQNPGCAAISRVFSLFPPSPLFLPFARARSFQG